MEALPDRAADPDEITGEVLRSEVQTEGRPSVAEPEGAPGDAETSGRATGKPLPAPFRGVRPATGMTC